MIKKQYNLPALALLFSGVIAFTILLGGCSSDEPRMKTPEDILGIWTRGEDHFVSFEGDNISRSFLIEEYQGDLYGYWEREGYFYEPGYDVLIYIDHNQKANVYQVVELTEENMVICWVEDLIDRWYGHDESIGQVIGEIINQAQEGFKLDPDKFEYLTRVSEEEFEKVLESVIVLDW